MTAVWADTDKKVGEQRAGRVEADEKDGVMRHRRHAILKTIDKCSHRVRDAGVVNTPSSNKLL